jgi:hypothetical protein
VVNVRGLSSLKKKLDRAQNKDRCCLCLILFGLLVAATICYLQRPGRVQLRLELATDRKAVGLSQKNLGGLKKEFAGDVIVKLLDGQSHGYIDATNFGLNEVGLKNIYGFFYNYCSQFNRPLPKIGLAWV